MKIKIFILSFQSRDSEELCIRSSEDSHRNIPSETAVDYKRLTGNEYHCYIFWGDRREDGFEFFQGFCR